MKKILILILVATCCSILFVQAVHSQSWSVTGGFTATGYTVGRASVASASDIYNFVLATYPTSLPTSVGFSQGRPQVLPNYYIPTPGGIAPVITITRFNDSNTGDREVKKINLRGGRWGAEIALKGINFSLFGEKDIRLYQHEEKPLAVVFAPRIQFGWNSRFPANPDWRTFLAQHAPHLSDAQLAQGAEVFAAATPQAFGNALYVYISPRIEALYSVGNSFSIVCFTGYQFDMISLVNDRHQSSLLLGLGARAHFNTKSSKN